MRTGETENHRQLKLLAAAWARDHRLSIAAAAARSAKAKVWVPQRTTPASVTADSASGASMAAAARAADELASAGPASYSVTR